MVGWLATVLDRMVVEAGGEPTVFSLFPGFSPFFSSICFPFFSFFSGTPIVAMCVQLAYTGGATGKHIKGRKGRTMLKILFITPEEIEGTLMTVGPKPSLFLH